MALPFLMNAAKRIADAAKQVADTTVNATTTAVSHVQGAAKQVADTTSAVTSSVTAGAQSAAKAFNETDAGKRLSEGMESAQQGMNAVGNQINSVVDSNAALSTVRDAGQMTGRVVGGAVGHMTDGLGGFTESERIVKAAKLKYETALADFKPRLEALHKDATRLETQKHMIQGGSFAQFRELYERQKKRMKITDKDFQINHNLTPEELSQFQQISVSNLELAKGGATAIAAGVAAGTGVVGVVATFAVASTGTAISTLSGAAATNAILAALGGGSLASGGGGMAAGAMVLGGWFVAPVLGIAALFAASKGHEALTKAHEYEAKVDIALAQLELKTVAVSGLQARIAEVSSVLSALDSRLLAQVQHCEHLERQQTAIGDAEKHEFLKAAALASTLVKVLGAAVYNAELEKNAFLPELVANAQRVIASSVPAGQA